MPLTRTRVITDEALKEKVYQRRKASLDQLTILGFTDYYCLDEEMFPLSLLFFFWMLPPMWISEEIPRITRRIGIGACYAYIIHPVENTYSHVFGLGCKFGTAFDDGTILMTNNFDIVSDNEKRKHFRFYIKGATITELWEIHRTKLAEFEQRGLRRLDKLTIEDIQAIEHRSDSVQMGLSEKKK